MIPLLTTGGVLLVVSMIVTVGIGAVRISPAEVTGAVGRLLSGTDPTADPVDFIVTQLRVPRVLEATIVGAGLAAAGAIAQAIVHNPIADPHILGLSSGAGLGAVIVLTVVGTGLLGTLTLPLAAFLGALVTGIVVYLLARGARGLEVTPLIMMGVAASSLLSGVTSLLVLSGDSQGTQNVMYWLLGSFAGAQWRLVGVSAVCVGAAGLATLVLARKLNLMALGDESAAALGIRPGKVRVGMFALCALMTGATVAVAGSIGFIGLVMPNLARLLVGDDYRRIVPVSMLLGALVLLWADTVARSVLAPGEIPIGVLTAFIGVPVLVVALRSRQGGLR